MCVALAHFDFALAFEAHPVIFILLPLWIAGIICWLFDKYPKFRSVIVYLSIVALIIFCIVRNIIMWCG